MGLAGVAEASKEYQAKKEAASQGSAVFFKLADGEEKTVRPLEEGDDFTSYYVHKLPQRGNRYPRVPCLDQRARPTGQIACPGCEEGLKRSYQFAMNVIVRNAPVVDRDEANNNRAKRDASGNLVWKKDGAGNPVLEDQVMVWQGGIEVAEDLDHLSGKYGGLTSRDFDVKRSGTRLNTTYRIAPLDKQPLTPKDEELRKGKFDLNQFKKPPAYEDFWTYDSFGGGGGGSSNGTGPSAQEQATAGSPFKRRDRTQD